MECNRCQMKYNNDVIYKICINEKYYDLCGWCLCYMRTYHLVEIKKNLYLTKIYNNEYE
jgi:hypothetical protein